MRQVDLGIDLSRGERAVAEELLDRAKVHPGFQKMRGECVSQGVWMEVIEVCRATDREVELAADGPVTEAAPTLVDEERLVLVTDTSAPTGAVGKIGLDGPRGRTPKRYEALLASFSAHPDNSLAELDITEVEGDQFADPEPGGVQQLHRSTVAAPRGGVWKSLEKLLDSVTVGDFRSPLDVVRVGHRIRGACLEGALRDQEAEICPESGEGAGNRARLETARVEAGEVGPHGHGCRLRGLFVLELRGNEIDERENFAAVGAKGCRGEIALPLEVFEERFDQPRSEVAATHSRALGRGVSLPRDFHHHRRKLSPNISTECFTAITLEASM